MNKNYIILCIIYKRVENAKIEALSYGYLMDMLWISCGEGTTREGKCTDNGPLLGYVLVGWNINETKSPINGRWSAALGSRCLD